MNEKTSSLRNGLFCCLVFLGCWLLAWPIAKMSFVDDWSYIDTAKKFAETGHFIFNGWTNAMLGWMVPWGALWIKVFGFSFMTVKLSTLPVAIATLLLFHAVLRRFGIRSSNAVIGVLTLGLSPLFMPLSASFMTDIPGLFAIVLCLYLCQRALDTQTDRAAIFWLIAAVATDVVGGTARQTAWLGVLVMVPCTGWLMRQRRRVFAAAVGLWIVGACGVGFCMHWFAQQPNVLPMPRLPHLPDSGIKLLALLMFWADLYGALILSLLLVVSPVLIPWLRSFGRKADHYIALFCFGVLPLIVARLFLGKLDVVWPPHVLFTELSTRKDASLVWIRAMHTLLIPNSIQIAISTLLIAALLGIVFVVRERGQTPTRSGPGDGAQRIFWLTVPFTVSYLMLLIRLISNFMAYDRYMLGIVPCVIAGLIWLYEQYVGQRLPPVSWVVLVVLSFFSVAGTHDWFAWQRARLSAIHELRAAGVPRSHIEGGYDYDGWTQVESGGLVLAGKVLDLGSAGQTMDETSDVHSPCRYWFLPALPVVEPQYSVAVGPFQCFLPSKFPGVHDTAWLPPFERTVEVQRVPRRD